MIELLNSAFTTKFVLCVSTMSIFLLFAFLLVKISILHAANNKHKLIESLNDNRANRTQESFRQPYSSPDQESSELTSETSPQIWPRNQTARERTQLEEPFLPLDPGQQFATSKEELAKNEVPKEDNKNDTNNPLKDK